MKRAVLCLVLLGVFAGAVSAVSVSTESLLSQLDSEYQTELGDKAEIENSINNLKSELHGDPEVDVNKVSDDVEGDEHVSQAALQVSAHRPGTFMDEVEAHSRRVHPAYRRIFAALKRSKKAALKRKGKKSKKSKKSKKGGRSLLRKWWKSGKKRSCYKRYRRSRKICRKVGKRVCSRRCKAKRCKKRCFKRVKRRCYRRAAKRALKCLKRRFGKKKKWGKKGKKGGFLKRWLQQAGAYALFGHPGVAGALPVSHLLGLHAAVHPAVAAAAAAASFHALNPYAGVSGVPGVNFASPFVHPGAFPLAGAYNPYTTAAAAASSSAAPAQAASTEPSKGPLPGAVPERAAKIAETVETKKDIITTPLGNPWSLPGGNPWANNNNGNSNVNNNVNNYYNPWAFHPFVHPFLAPHPFFAPHPFLGNPFVNAGVNPYARPAGPASASLRPVGYGFPGGVYPHPFGLPFGHPLAYSPFAPVHPAFVHPALYGSLYNPYYNPLPVADKGKAPIKLDSKF